MATTAACANEPGFEVWDYPHLVYSGDTPYAVGCEPVPPDRLGDRVEVHDPGHPRAKAREIVPFRAEEALAVHGVCGKRWVLVIGGSIWGCEREREIVLDLGFTPYGPEEVTDPCGI